MGWLQEECRCSRPECTAVGELRVYMVDGAILVLRAPSGWFVSSDIIYGVFLFCSDTCVNDALTRETKARERTGKDKN